MLRAIRCPAIHARQSERGTDSGGVTGSEDCATNMELNKCLLNGYCVPGMYTGTARCLDGALGLLEKGVGRLLPEHTQWSDATSNVSAIQNKGT